MALNIGDKVVTTGAIPTDRTVIVKRGLVGYVVGLDVDGKYKVRIDGEDSPWYLQERELRKI